MGLEERIEDLEKSVGHSSQDYEIVQFNVLLKIATSLLTSGKLKSTMSIEALRALKRPYPDLNETIELTPEKEKELKILTMELRNGTERAQRLWDKYGTGKYPFERKVE